jgi:RNA 3'-terminal phosphate cyclase (ATP)
MIRIDGSQGEGGGQILRTSLSLSLVTGQPFTIEKIRANREKSGLLRQHLTAVLAAAEIGKAKVEGAELGSKTLTFVPTKVHPGEYKFAVGTAGSGTLVLQTVLPALMIAKSPSKLVIEGGTHNMAAPPFDFLAKTFIPLIRRMGPKITLKLERYGFYPAGGGRFTVEIEPCERIEPINLIDRGELKSRRVTAVVALLPHHIANREVETVGNILGFGRESMEIIDTKESSGPGNVVMVEIESENITEICTAFGKIGVRSETVAQQAAVEAAQYAASTAFAGEHLADQLLLPMAIAGSGSFSAVRQSEHTRTNIAVIRQFLPVDFEVSNFGDAVHFGLVAGDRASANA